MPKRFVSPNELYRLSKELAMEIIKSQFKPDWLLALWRGGTPIGINVHEMLKFYGYQVDHIAIRTSSYKGVDDAEEHVRVHCLDYFLENAKKEDRVLIVDDVFDRGLTMGEVLRTIKRELPEDRCPPQINFKIATVFWKPEKNQTNPLIMPDYYNEKIAKDVWVVFAHELVGLSLDEIAQFYGQQVAYFLMGADL